MTTAAVLRPPARADLCRPVAGVRARSSLGVARYCDRLADALRRLGVDYEAADRLPPGREAHLHLANSSRRVVVQAARTERFVVTVHDVRPRADVLLPLHRLLVHPTVVERAAAVVVHSGFAADLLLRLGAEPRRIEVIPHPAPPAPAFGRAAARAELGLANEPLLAVLPGVVKGAKLVREAIAAVREVRESWRLVLAGPIRDRRVAEEARRAGALVVESPDDARYEQLIVGADVVLCLRSGSVGETNGPLMDALGLGRAILATPTGSIPETAADAAVYVEGVSGDVAAGLRLLSDPGERTRRERAAAERATQLSWRASAEAHARLFAEVFGA